ncbi:GNAT family N-acetyltransferase [Betaproteobacteria bacterium PRO7]|jgi:ribosomal protein S18 acetylase RimI-like enzyme|nr:GNAT family N-acetyltransferase [Betaproteobacteria bacterium PRO7]
MGTLELQLRSASPEDAVTIAALAVQVFLDTYATEGVRPDQAREAFAEYSVEAFAVRVQEPTRRFFLAEHAAGLLGFAEMQLAAVSAPGATVVGAELVRLYVQPGWQRHGVGRRLIRSAERAAASSGLTTIWLTAWEGNSRARGFYAALGYQDIGTTTYSFQGKGYVNRVLAKSLHHAAGAV